MAVIRVGDGDAVRVTGATKPRRCYSLGIRVQSKENRRFGWGFTRAVGKTCIIREIYVVGGNIENDIFGWGYFQIWTGQSKPVSYNEILDWTPLIPCYYHREQTMLWTMGGSVNILSAKPMILLEGEERRFAATFDSDTETGGQITVVIDIEEL